MLPRSLSFLDLETTGINSNFNKVIEIGIIRVDDDKITKEFQSLIDPGIGIPVSIQDMTGIRSADLEIAPTFYELADEIREILDGSILVAHNVRFDYGFLKSEFRQIDTSFNMKHFCSVKLARDLFPGLDHYNLDAIIRHFNLSCENRHRAFDDAKVIYDFYNKIQESVSEDFIAAAINRALKKPSVPIGLSEKVLDDLPESPGVYIFYGEDKYPIYIGKSVNIRDRVLSHFSNDHSLLKDMQISQEVKHVDTIRTAGELGALLLESTLIKKYQPLYNQMLREARRMIIILRDTNDDGYSTIRVKEVEKIEVSESEEIIGVFRSQKQLKNHLFELCKQFSLCPKIMDLEHSQKSCFYYHLKMCNGACIGKESSFRYNLRFTEAFFKYKLKRWYFDTPVLIKEKGELEEGFIIDKWCLLGSVKSEADLSEISNDYRFDLDTYKILSKFLLHPPKNISVKPIHLGNHNRVNNN